MKSSLKKTVAFANEGSSNTDTDKIMARIEAVTMKMDAQYKKSNLVQITRPLIVTTMTHPYLAKKKQNLCKPSDVHVFTIIVVTVTEIAIILRSSGRNDYNRDYYRSNSDDKPDLQRQLSKFIKAQQLTNSFVKDTFMDLKTKLETTTKNHQASIQNLEAKFDRFADKQSARPSGSLPSNTQPNPKGISSKPYQPPQARNEHVNDVFTRSDKFYNPPTNPNNQQNDSETPVNFDSKDEDEESTP
ncbi:hypothetical protein Tco_0528035 [Tanacetum coccineum]